jgi:hypothetical protein
MPLHGNGRCGEGYTGKPVFSLVKIVPEALPFIVSSSKSVILPLTNPPSTRTVVAP